MRNLPITRQTNQARQQQDVEYILLPEAEGTSEKNLTDYLCIIRRRKWFVIIPFFIIMPIVVLGLYTKRPIYQATTTILIEKVNPRILSIEEVLKPEPSPDFYSTQYEIIQSRAIAEQVVDALQLDKKVPPEESPLVRQINAVRRFPEKMLNAAANAIEAVFKTFTGTQANITTSSVGVNSDPADQRRQNAIAQLQSALKIRPRPGMQLVDITLHGDNPEDVTQQANMVAETYVRQNLENKLDASRKAIVWLRKEANALKEKIHNAELAMQDFKEREKFTAPDRFEETQNLVQKKFDALQLSYIETNTARKSLQEQINQLKKSSEKDIEGIIKSNQNLLNNSLIQYLKGKYAELQIQYSDISNKFGYKHPMMKKIESEIQTIDNTINLEIQKVINGMYGENKVLLAKEQMLERELESQRKALYKLSSKITRYNELTRDLEVDKELYQAVSKRLAETTLTEALATNNSKIVERALVPRAPVSSGMVQVALGMMAAFGLGVGLALLTERLDKRFHSTDEAERYLGIPFLACIPRYNLKRNKPVTLHEPWASASEAYRTLRTWVQLSFQKSGETLMITSAVPAEGKSTTAANLAISFAQLGRMVLLIDADLRRSSVHRAFGVANRGGLTDILMHGAEWKPMLQDTAMENLKVLPAGSKPLNPAELLSTRGMKSLLESLQSAFDIIIFDVPMILSVPDAAILASEMAGVLLVHYPAKGDKEAVLEAKRTLERAGANLLGVVFNNVSPKEQKYYYQQYYYYPYASVKPTYKSKVYGPFVDMRPAETRERWLIESKTSHEPPDDSPTLC